MFSTAALRQAAAHAERTPMIRFIGRRTTPASIDHSPRPHPASPTGKLPLDFASPQGAAASKHTTFSSYRDHAQQFGPLRKTIKSTGSVGAAAGSQLGPVAAPHGMFFDRSELPERFRRTPVDLAEMEAVESGGATLLN